MIFINTNDVQGARHVAMKEGFGTWLHVSMEEKERAKKIVGMKTLPFMLAVMLHDSIHLKQVCIVG